MGRYVGGSEYFGDLYRKLKLDNLKKVDVGADTDMRNLADLGIREVKNSWFEPNIMDKLR